MQDTAWAAHSGKTPLEAMQEFLDLLTDSVPTWRLAHMIADRSRTQSKEKSM